MVLISVRVLELLFVAESWQVLAWLLLSNLLASLCSLLFELILNLLLNGLALADEGFGPHRIIIPIHHLLESIKLKYSLDLLVELLLLLLGQLGWSLNHLAHKFLHDSLRLLCWKQVDSWIFLTLGSFVGACVLSAILIRFSHSRSSHPQNLALHELLISLHVLL